MSNAGRLRATTAAAAAVVVACALAGHLLMVFHGASPVAPTDRSNTATTSAEHATGSTAADSPGHGSTHVHAVAGCLAVLLAAAIITLGRQPVRCAATGATLASGATGILVSGSHGGRHRPGLFNLAVLLQV